MCREGDSEWVQEGEKLDKEALMREAISGQMKERQELERKVQSQARKADHLERARREEEAPFLLAAYDKRLEVGETPLPTRFSWRTPYCNSRWLCAAGTCHAQLASSSPVVRS